MKRSLYTACAVILAVTTCSMAAAPKPAIIQGPLQWTADLTFENLAQIVYQPTNIAKPRRFWYTILTVTNNTGQDIDFYHKCDLMTDSFQIIPAGKLVPTEVFNMIAARHQHKYPLLANLSAVNNSILQGEDNAVDIAVIWSDFDARAKQVSLFITGLSNETAVVNAPLPGNTDHQVFLRKTLELSYQLKGGALWRSNQDVVLKDKTWVMR
jgi:hypothetical protein